MDSTTEKKRMRRGLVVIAILSVALTGWTAARSGAGASTTDRPVPVSPTQAPTAHESTVRAQTRLVPAADGNQVRYRVREQLASISFPSDAVGSTTAITGAIVVEDDGSIVAGESRFVVDLTGLTSDVQMRDRYVQRNTLETADSTNRQAVFVPTSFSGLTLPLPRAGQLSFRVTGPFTVRGRTHATTWDVTAQPTAQGVRGTAKTAFTFEDIGLPKPRVARVLSVVDTIRLEYDFNLVREPAR